MHIERVSTSGLQLPGFPAACSFLWCQGLPFGTFPTQALEKPTLPAAHAAHLMSCLREGGTYQNHKNQQWLMPKGIGEERRAGTAALGGWG